MAKWGSYLKIFLMGGWHLQLKSVKNMLFTITVSGYLHQQGAWSNSKLITEFKKFFAEYYTEYNNKNNWNNDNIIIML